MASKTSKSKGKITTIKLSIETKERLDKLREFSRESYEEILQKTLSILNLSRVNPERARSRLITIDRRNRPVRSRSSHDKNSDSN